MGAVAEHSSAASRRHGTPDTVGAGVVRALVCGITDATIVEVFSDDNWNLMAMTLWQEEVWQWIAAVPHGKVATYGQIAGLSGYPRHARHVGAILRDLPEGSRLPWHRIVRSSGELAFATGSDAWQRQRGLLAAEGVELRGGRVDMARHQWQP